MIIGWLAGGAIVLILTIWAASFMVLKAKGGALPVDNDRDINDRYFAQVLRNLLQPAAAPGWGKHITGDWFLGEVQMHRRAENVAVFRGDLYLDEMPYKVAALVVTGDLTIAAGSRITCDIWSLGDVTVGPNCALRALTADGSVTVGARSTVERWVDAAQMLRLRHGVTVVTAATAGEELDVGAGFRGGKLAAPEVRINPVLNTTARNAALERIDVYRSLRERYRVPGAGSGLVAEVTWIQPESVYSEGRFWTGPGTVLLHDLIIRDDLEIGGDSVIAGSLHVDGDCRIGPRSLVTGSVACKNLIMEEGSVVGGSVHVDGDATVGEGALVGLLPDAGGLSVTGSIRLVGEAAVAARVSANQTLSTGYTRGKTG